MVRTDPYRPTHTEYECGRCGARLDAAEATCENLLCDGEARNLAVARE